MNIFKTKNVRTPSYGTPGSAGLDFYVPDEFNSTIVYPHQGILIASGIKANVPKSYMLVAFNKSGVFTKKGLSVGACVVDEDYQGEIHISLFNTTENPVTINAGDKIVQFILIPYIQEVINIVESESILFENNTSERGSGAFGSTDSK